MKIKNRMWFLAADDGGGEGGSAGLAAVNEPAVEPTGEGEVVEPVVEPKVEPTTSTIDPKAFAKEFGDVLGQHFKKEEPKQEKLSPEEAKKLLNVWEPDDSWHARYDNIETRKDAVKEMRDKLVAQADTLAQLRFQEIAKGLEAKFSPALEAMQRMETQQRETRFTTNYPQLAKPELRPLIMAVGEDLRSKGKTFGSEEELFTALANGVESVIKVNNPEFKLTAAGTASVNKAKANNSIPTTTPGASGGVGTSGKAPAGNKAKGLAIFDK